MQTQMAVEKRERPIIFSGEMVKKVLSGEKTQTRRVIKEQRTHPHLFENRVAEPSFVKFYEHDLWGFGASFVRGDSLDCLNNELTVFYKSPFGKVGDLLWVRETWRRDDFDFAQIIYKSDMPEIVLREAGDLIKWKSPIHMPRKASRITLEITNIKVERLQDISAEDVAKEGFHESHYYCDEIVGHVCTETKELLKNRWDLINGKFTHTCWKGNPFVWVIEFRQMPV